MIVHALQEGAGDVDAMVGALEGWTFDAPKGEQTIRESDHAMLQPMFLAKLTKSGGSWTPEPVKTAAGRPGRPARGGELTAPGARTGSALTVEGLCFSVGGAQILDRVDLAVPAGEFLGVIGPNGAGKTTLFNCVSGLVPATGGRDPSRRARR